MIKLESKHLNYEYLSLPAPSKDRFVKHLHNEYEMLYFINGDADYMIGATVYHLKKNDLLIIKPAEYHYLKLLSSLPYERHVINFSEKAIPKEVLPFMNKIHSIYSVPQGSTIDKIFEEIKNMLENNCDQTKLTTQINYSFKLILVYLNNLTNISKVKPLSTNALLSDILKYIDKNPESEISSDLLSKKFFVSPSWITHTFRKMLGISLKQYVNHKKILYAQQLISKGAKPTKVAKICSFDNYSTFYRLYKKYAGNIPLSDKVQQ